MDLDSLELDQERPIHRRWFAQMIITASLAVSLGVAMRMPTLLEANDISRWCTVWALVEKGTYAIDECPWQPRTQDKVYKVSPFAKEGDVQKHFYSSKPPLLATMIAGIVYPVRWAVGVPLHAEVLQERVKRKSEREDPKNPGKYIITDDPLPPVKWPVHIFYLKPIIVLLNHVPFLIMLLLYARLLDRYATNDWAWLLSLTAAAFATPLTVFLSTLNNHTISAFSLFFASYSLLRIYEIGAEAKTASLQRREDDEAAASKSTGIYFAVAGFFGAFCACNELPAAGFGVLLFLILLFRDVRRTLLYFVPAAIIPCAAFLVTQYVATGTLKPTYAEFGTESYTGYEWSFWITPLELDWFDKHPEPKWLYLTHLLVGHHGLFSLTPLFLFSLAALPATIFSSENRLRGIAGLTLLLTVMLVGFYVFGVKSANYGGSTQGARWLFWVYPLWLMILPASLSSADRVPAIRFLSLVALGLSMLSVGYGFRSPWSHPWILDLIEHLNLYTLTR